METKEKFIGRHFGIRCMVRFAPVVTGRSNYFGIGFSTVILKPLIQEY